MVEHEDESAGLGDVLAAVPVALRGGQQRRLHDGDADAPRPPALLLQLANRHGRRLLGHRASTVERPERIEPMSGQQFVVLVPVKPPAVGKSRLARPRRRRPSRAGRGVRAGHRHRLPGREVRGAGAGGDRRRAVLDRARRRSARPRSRTASASDLNGTLRLRPRPRRIVAGRTWCRSRCARTCPALRADDLDAVLAAGRAAAPVVRPGRRGHGHHAVRRRVRRVRPAVRPRVARRPPRRRRATSSPTCPCRCAATSTTSTTCARRSRSASARARPRVATRAKADGPPPRRMTARRRCRPVKS